MLEFRLHTCAWQNLTCSAATTTIYSNIVCIVPLDVVAKIVTPK
jgi:hypothetical protein